MNRFVILLGLIILFSSCQETKRVYIASTLADCEGVAPQQCMKYKENHSDEWTYFYDTIEGFDYQEGYSYELEVVIAQVENPAADASSLKYSLVKILSKEKDQSIAQQLPVQTKPQDQNTISTIEYQALSRGSFFQVTIEKNSIEKTTDRSLKNKTTTECSEKDWNTVLSIVQKMEVEKINELKAPTDKRLFDGALNAQVKFIYQNKTFTSSSFDHGHPPEELKQLVNTILSLAESIE